MSENEDIDPEDVMVMRTYNLKKCVQHSIREVYEDTGIGVIDDEFIEDMCKEFAARFKDSINDEGNYSFLAKDYTDFILGVQDALLDKSLTDLIKKGDIEPLVASDGEFRYRLTDQGRQRVKDKHNL